VRIGIPIRKAACGKVAALQKKRGNLKFPYGEAKWEDDAGPPIVPGVKTQLLEQFKPVNQNPFNEAKLRERKQGIEESTIEYFYDILDLCLRVDPNMTEATKLAHLWRGLRPSLLEKLWSLKPNSCDEFLQKIKRYQEMTSRARHEEWAMGVVGKKHQRREVREWIE
ncbi:Uncharacterized protein APZ42_003697, partial [Daphnia magna]